MSMFEVWLLFVVLPNIKIPLMILFGLGLFFILFGWIAYSAGLDLTFNDRKYDHEKNTWSIEVNNKQKFVDKYLPLLTKGYKISIVSVIISSFLLCIVPDKKEVAAMVVIPYVSDNPEFKKLPANIAKHLNELLDEYLPSKEEVKTNEQ
jgi:hypothetical protein